MTSDQQAQIEAARWVASTMRGKTPEEIKAALRAQGYAAAAIAEVKV